MRLFALLASLVLIASHIQAAESNSYTTNDAFSLTLRDGSVLMCNPQLKEIPIKTSYAEMTVPLDRVIVISNNLAKGESILVMKNGDLVRGKCALKDITLLTLVGKITVPMSSITELNSRAKRKRTFKDSPARRNRCINNMRMIDAGKEQSALANRWAAGREPDIRTVNSYIKGDTTPICPAGGEYKYGVIGVNPLCDCPGHVMPGF